MVDMSKVSAVIYDPYYEPSEHELQEAMRNTFGLPQ